ncbi:MFS transporter [Rugosimonospora africana]|uniref:MFS transporter n=1 Tax=Rugosimonospora africana TaxID=556532 RepID=A0A8J3VW84_9ACTN|nr:MFS transporter [Rugosimonospora africana]GIH20561.1 MFS transporter [Rugosimonospora africana]
MFAPILRNREFRAMALTEAMSTVGDQLTRVALALLVFDRTGSAGLGGLTYALTFLPTVAGGLLLSPLADTRPRRSTLIAIDVLRGAAVLAMVAPGTPLVVLWSLVAFCAFLNGPYSAARLALLRDVLSQDQYGAGMALRQSLSQGAQLLGFLSGGLLASIFSPGTCLLFDCASFVGSALTLRIFVRPRPAALSGGERSTVAGTVRLVWGSPVLRTVFLTTFTGLFFLGPDALAAPLASELSLSARWVGFFMASGGLFSVIGLAAFGRFVSADRYLRAFPISFLAPGLPLLPVVVVHDPIKILILFGISGAAWAVLTVIAVTSFAGLLPDDQRGRAMGVAGSMNATSQGVGAFLAGLLADAVGVGCAISLLGAAGVLFALLAIAGWRRAVVNPTRSITGARATPDQHAKPDAAQPERPATYNS